MKKLTAILAAFTILCGAYAPTVLAAPSQASSEASSGQSSSQSSSSSDDPSGASSKDETAKDTSSTDDKSGDEKKEEAAQTPASGGVSSATRYPPDFANELYSQAIYMENLDSNTRVFEKEPQKRMSPASLTKMMTAIVALESGVDLDNETAALKPYIQNELYMQKVDTLGGIYLGESLTIRDLLYAMMTQSANEAAMMVADYIGDGSIPYFCELMNKKAKEIGAVNTNFSNATGLYAADNYSTAYDMALIAKYAMQNPDFVDLVTVTGTYTSKPTDKHPNGITWYAGNAMQQSSSEYYYEGLKGIKTGTLAQENMRNFVSTASRDGYTYLLVCMGAPYQDEEGAQFIKNLAWRDTERLYDWAFDTFRVKTLMNVGDEVAGVGVRLSWDKDYIKLLAADKFASLVPKETTEDSVHQTVIINDYVELPVKDKNGKKSDKTQPYIDAPVKRGDEVGYVKLMLDGEEVGRVRLVAAESVEQSTWLYYMDMAKTFLNTFVFKFVLTFIIVVALLYIALMIIRNRNKRRYKVRRKRPPTKRSK